MNNNCKKQLQDFQYYTDTVISSIRKVVKINFKMKYNLVKICGIGPMGLMALQSANSDAKQPVEVGLVMSRVQCSPEEAAQALRDCGGDVSVAIRSFSHAPKVLNQFRGHENAIFSL